MKVFFYGLFMDEALLASKGIQPSSLAIGSVSGYALRIGERATLVASTDSRAYGVVMDVAEDKVRALYSDDSVADYVPEPVTVELLDNSRVKALCYNLPQDKIAGTNSDYAAKLLELARRLGFPEAYLAQIK